VPAVIAKLKHNFRYQLLIKQKHGARLAKQVVRTVEYQFRQRIPTSKVKVEIDVDTQSMM
jgi:primosomal protein N'